jgi:bacterioferritin-associated ferredoxin
MIVCHCQVVSDKTIRASIESGARTVGDVARRCGAGTGPRCGACRPTIEALLALHPVCVFADAAPAQPAA